MKTIIHTLLGLTMISMVACNKTEIQNIEAKQARIARVTPATAEIPASAPERIGPDQIMVTAAYFQGTRYTLWFKKAIDEPGGGSFSPIRREPMELYTYAAATVQRSKDKLIPITTAIDDIGVKILLREVKIHFNSGFTPRQFYSRDEILNATLGIRPEINIENTGVAFEAKVSGDLKSSLPQMLNNQPKVN